MFRDDHGCQRFSGKNCIVTAGSAGIGLAACHRLCSEGGRVFLCSRKQANVDKALQELQHKYGKDSAAGVTCNVTKSGELEKFVEQARIHFNGQFHHVLSNVGMNPSMGKAVDMEMATYDKIMDTNLKSHWKLVKLCYPYLVKPNASIVLVSSNAGFQPEFPLGIYGVSKTALIGLGKALASELGPEGIRCNTICPGLVRTKMAEALWNSDGGKVMEQRLFLRRLADPDDMSGTIAYLLSEDARHVTGETVMAAGGINARL